MEDRILVNGVWYVRENTIPEVEIDENELASFQGIVYETIDYAFEATKYENDKYGGYLNGIDIKFTDKRDRPWKEEFWDNNNFFKGIIENNPDSLNDLRNSVCVNGEAQFKAFLKYLQQKQWI